MDDIEVYADRSDDVDGLFSGDESSEGFGKEEVDSGMSNSDYNLDSPINPDFIEGVMRYMRTDTAPSHHRIRIVRECTILSAVPDLNWQTLQSSTSFHPIIGKWMRLLSHPIGNPPDGVSKILQQVVEDYGRAGLFSEVFLDRTCGKTRLHRSEFHNLNASRSYYSMSYLIGYIHLHVIILIMNGRRENTAIAQQSRKSNWVELGIFIEFHNTHISVLSSTFGRLLIGGETVVWMDEQLIMDKNMVLMFKDMCVGRFMTLNILEGSGDSVLAQLSHILAEGDQLLVRHGNVAYDTLKLLEPMCVLRWLDISSRTSYDRLSANNFRRHISSSITDKVDGSEKFHQVVSADLNSILNSDQVGTIFGSFRLYGHPLIMYEEGLLALKTQCRLPKKIDQDYAKTLADDFTFIILKNHYRNTGQWALKSDGLPKPLQPFVKEGRWSSEKVIKGFTFHWSDLDKIPVFEVPSDIPLSQLYSDKSFSMTRAELSNHLQKPGALHNPISSNRVLEELLERPTIDPRKFAQDINDNGLDINDLIIGLKEKERELKRIGRFFTLMSWKLREYIVLSEFLIKKFFIPLFDGVTMSDGLTTVVKKMMNPTNEQSSDLNRTTITYSNHIDYEKWNNHQRGEAVNPVFKVMGEFIGLPNFFTRTHEFFLSSLIYYTGRPDRIFWVSGPGGLSVNEARSSLAWNGQPGGLEGVRQKGWTIVGILCILKEGSSRNTRIRELAQGANQVIFTAYKLVPDVSYEEQTETIGKNNSTIMKNIGLSVRRLGLIINEDETFTSGGFTIYGKVPIMFGNLINLETKRWNRITCVTNDQIPTICNVMGVIGSTALGSAQGSPGFEKQFDMFIHYSLLMFTIHDKCNVLGLPPLEISCDRVEFVGRLLFLDKSIGGYTGISPTRFLIRQFPDPITESLSFWKPLLDSPNQSIKSVASMAWNPIIKRRSGWIRELAENPSGLNIEGGSNIENIFKKEVKSGLIRRSDQITNEIIRSSLELSRDYEDEILAFLESVQPCFPRFISGFLESSVIGISDGVIGLIQNSRTMRNVFKRSFSDKVFHIVMHFESKAMWFLEMKGKCPLILPGCGATRADELRDESWGQPIVGQTIPHPYEFLRYNNKDIHEDHIGVGCPVRIPSGRVRDVTTGPVKPYIGSKTSEDTSVLKTWEKELVNPLGRKAFQLLRCIDWFVPIGSNLSNSIANNLETITKLSGFTGQKTTQRSGCPIHRFSVSRQSSGGFSSICPNILRWVYVTAESWSWGTTENMDFMHQSAMLYAQCCVVSLINNDRQYGVFNKFNLDCSMCMRKIPSLQLDSSSTLRVIKG